MSQSVSQHIAALTLDPWRQETGFSTDLHESQSKIFAAAEIGDKEAVISEINKWLQHKQPCLFGRIAAKRNEIEYCILLEEDLALTDEEICAKIKLGRLCWHRAGYLGQKSAFVILVLSKKIANAKPDSVMQSLACRVCSLYLREEIEPDKIYTDELFLEIPDKAGSVFKWPAGVNYFCAQGDGRWWQDHRIPGGMAFSMNSVGHMVKSRRLAQGLNQLLELVGLPQDGDSTTIVDSLEKSLSLAMRTIHGASNAISGQATSLLVTNDEDLQRLPKCPVELPPFLVDKNHCEYKGFYDTDCTVPSEYFVEDIERPSWVQGKSLDFTYLFHGSIDNPDHEAVADGIQIRDIHSTGSAISAKTLKGEPVEVMISENPLLMEALQDR